MNPLLNLPIAPGGGSGGSGDVTGPASSTDEAIARFNGAGGKTLQNSGVTISDTDVVSGATQLNVDNLRLDGNTVSTTNSNGNLILNPDGTGDLSLFGETATDLRVRLATSPSPSTGPAARIITGNAGAGADLLASSIFSPNETFPTVGINNGNVIVASGGVIGAYSSSTDFSGSRDTGLSRIAAGVWGVGTGAAASRAGWVQWAGEAFLAADGTNDTTTMASTGLSVTVTTGRKYGFSLMLFLSNTVAADGAKIDFDGGTATATNFIAHGTLFDSALLLSARTSALATDLAAATVTGSALFEVEGSFEPSSTGTFIPRYAMNAATTGVLTLARGSRLLVWDMP